MKKNLYNRICFLLFCCIAGVMVLSACEEKDDMTAPPVITEIRNYAASPSDSLVNTLKAGQWVVLLGKNLGEISQVNFGSRPANINPTLITDQSIVVQVPSIPFDSVAREKVNVVTVINRAGSTSFTINITGPPIISRVRNFATAPKDTVTSIIVPGQSINIVGYNLKNALTVAFQGVAADLKGAVYTDSSVIVKVPVIFPARILYWRIQSLMGQQPTQSIIRSGFLTQPSWNITRIPCLHCLPVESVKRKPGYWTWTQKVFRPNLKAHCTSRASTMAGIINVLKRAEIAGCMTQVMTAGWVRPRIMAP
jgi:hypothetical protein